MKPIIAIDGFDRASVDRNDALLDDRPIVNDRSRCDLIVCVRRGFVQSRALDLDHAIAI